MGGFQSLVVFMCSDNLYDYLNSASKVLACRAETRFFSTAVVCRLLLLFLIFVQHVAPTQLSFATLQIHSVVYGQRLHLRSK